MADLLARAVFHSLVAALAVEALLRLWKVAHPGERLRFHLLVLAVPFVLEPAFHWLAPGRGEETFRDTQALFAGARWEEVRPFGVGLYRVWLGALAAFGVALLALDLAPFAVDLKRSRASRRRAAGRAGAAAPGARARHEPPPWAADVQREVDALAARMGVRVPRVVGLERPGPLLHCAGWRRPVLVVSSGALALLDGRERTAALAHELGHLAHRDPLESWALLAARTLQAFNPVFQVAARVVARELEWRADDVAVRTTGDPLSLASALLKLYRAAHAQARGGWLAQVPLLSGPVRRASHRAVEARCRRLLDGPDPRPGPLAPLRLALTGASLTGLLYHVV